MVDIINESTLTIGEVCQILPRGRNGSKPHYSCVCRWITKGTKDPNGHFVKLEAVRLGSKWVTSKEAVQRFVERLTPVSDATAPAPRSASERTRAAEHADAILRTKGI